MRQLGVGHDGSRITIPLRNPSGWLRGVLRYDPFGRRQPKMLSVRGTRLGLAPHPATETSQHVILVEGLPDMIAARSCGLSAIGVPGTHAWKPAWAELLTGRRVTIVMDCDAPGRRAAFEMATALDEHTSSIDVIDLDPARVDGFDLTDRILERRQRRPSPPHPQPLAALLRSSLP
jgi:DNA primase